MRDPQGRPIRRPELKRYSRAKFVESGYIIPRLQDKKVDTHAVGFTAELLAQSYEEGEGD